MARSGRVKAALHELAERCAQLPLAQSVLDDPLCTLPHRRQLVRIGLGDQADGPDGRLYITVGDTPTDLIFAEEVGHMRRIGPDQQDRPGHGHRSVYLAWVNDADHLLHHGHHVHVGR